MELTIEKRGKSYGKIHQARLKEIRRYLETLTTQEDAEALLVLADALLVYSHSQALLKRSGKELIEWLKTFLDFLHCRDGEVKVAPFQPKNSNSSFLLVNTPDVPYLVDSLKTILQKLPQRAKVISHPVLTIQRSDGLLTSLDKKTVAGPKESFLLVQFEGARDLDTEAIEEDVSRVFLAAQVVGRQYEEMEEKILSLANLAEDQDQKNFLEWLLNGNFICFGYAAVDASGTNGGATKAEFTETPLGWLPPSLFSKGKGRKALQLTAEAKELFARKNPLVVEVLDEQSPLYQQDNLIYIGFRECCKNDKKTEHLLVGLFSKNSINELASNVPPLRDKLLSAFKRQDVQYESYDYRKVVEIFNTFPKVEMFFLKDKELDSLVKTFVSLQRHQSVRLVVTRSLSLRGFTLLAIMPRDYYSRDSVRRMEAYLGRFLSADHISSRVVHFYSEYVSLHFRIVPSGDQVRIDIDALQKVLTDLSRPWDEKLRLLLLREEKIVNGMQLWHKFANTFPHDYKDLIHPRFAIRDVLAIDQVLKSGEDGFDLWGPFQDRYEFFRLQFYSLKESCLNELMPFLGNLMLDVIDEVDFNLEVDERTIYVKSFAIRNNHPKAKPLTDQRENLLEVLKGLRNGSIEDDYLNRLMVLTGLDWQELDVFRAYRNYYFQLGNPFTKRRAAFALLHNPEAALLLYRYFEARFSPNPDWQDPMKREEEALMPIRMELVQVLEQISDINEDRILRSFFNLIDSTIRTNFFLRRDDPDYFLSFKISAIGIIDMPFPRPMYETYVHSATMEGIHLRGGKVARGGIRWSDRPDDFRTEVLGLMKTQMTKNTLIVPVGSKGGFVVKTPFTTREEGAELSRQAYITLMRGLLDLVDNRVAGKIERPEGVVVYDDADPYLVVAADKGTAHLPDTANSVSIDYGFWLGDAFASGGSVGYDHKKLGITARGAWECVKRHFRELGKDIQSEDFTVVGIGDMSGDVFGNGMLLSKHTRLLAAFNHMHIFLDPDPDAGKSWLERKRLFELPRSGWADYDPDFISEGGGVWDRSSKDIPLSPAVRKWLGVRHATMEGEELIRRLLVAEMELLWNGGVGTYIKSSLEKNADVGDRANDNVRVNASQLKAKVIGEGGNLGLTQPARIEYAMAGGLINTDAVDNSAGVDTSDHEVNLKIFFQVLRESGVIKTERTRNRQLQEVENDVCDVVLANNYTQSLCLSLDLLRCQEDSEPFIDLSERLTNAGLLDRKGEFLPSRKELTARGQAYLRPELTILLAYSKMQLFQTLLESSIPDQEAGQVFLKRYFPEKINKRYSAQIKEHPLKREIIATMITNRVVDNAGCAFLNTLVRQAGATIIQGVAAYLVFDEVLDGEAIRDKIMAADNKMSSARQYELLLSLETALAGLCRQAIEQGLPMGLDKECIKSYRQRLATFQTHLGELLPKAEWQLGKDAAAALVKEGFSKDMAFEMASFRYLVGFLPAVYIAEATGAKLLEVTTAMGQVRQRLRISDVMASLNDYMPHDRWDRMALTSLRSAFIKQAVKLTRLVVAEGGCTSGFLANKRQRLDYYLGMVETLRATPPTSTSPYMVLLRALEAVED
ncbi:MAG: NAD-glutamate dehydrogenase [Deltaproteobacteria bacterium]|nr:MAG: NAD-glutamate dehydrogenase [Deltaproteobacteria bacterium]